MDIVSELNANEKNITALRTIVAPPWVSAPSYRGTTSILWSCLVTLIACIYSAIHLNIPTTTSKFKILLLKGKWVLIALVAPEIVLFCATNQWYQAKTLISSLNELRSESEQARQQAPGDFDMGYGFFVVMGGLRVSTREINETNDSMALRTNGVLELARQGHFIYIRPEELEDRGKASILQKILIICQVTWMVIQCAARHISGLPLALLEVHTMVHVVCALMMYIFWFNKPLDIASPQLITGTAEFNQAVAFMFLETASPGLADDIVIYPTYFNDNAVNAEAIAMIPGDGLLTRVEGPLESSGVPLEWVDLDPNGGVTIKTGQATKFGIGLKRTAPNEMKIFPRQMVLLYRAAAFVRKYDGPEIQLPQLLHPHRFPTRYENSKFHKALHKKSTNFPHKQSFDWRLNIFDILLETVSIAVIAMVLPILYGGVHLSAWNFAFPTAIEHLIWKIACFDVMLTIPVAIVTLFIISFFVASDGSGSSFDSVMGTAVLILLKFLYYAGLLLYGASRFYLVVESFISLRKVPIGVYWTPAWIQMIPHV